MATKLKNSSPQNRNLMIVGGIVVVAVVAAVVFILISSSGSGSAGVDYSAIPQSRAADGAFVLGNPEAPVTIIEFADFLCPHCQEYEPTMEAFIKQYVATGLAKFEYRFFPVIDQTLSRVAAHAAECSETLEPGSFWRARDALYDIASRSLFSGDSAREFATRMGFNYSALLRCMNDASQVETDYAKGAQLGVQGTPAVMVQYGDNDPQWISIGGQTLNRGIVDLQVLGITVQAAQNRSP